MSEYQYYEFVALDRPLTGEQMSELRALTTRATITPTRLQNVYHWGSFRGDPSTLMEKYFDAFLYVANWGVRRFMLRLPRRLLGPEVTSHYCACEGADVEYRGDFAILEFCSRSEGAEGFEEGEGWLSSLVPLRADLAAGDHRALYLGWLLCAQEGHLDDDSVEPPVPAGLGSLSAPLEAFAEFLRIDRDLTAVAAERSAPVVGTGPDDPEVERWIHGLPEVEKDRLLLRLVREGDPHLRAELLQGFQRSKTPPEGTAHAGWQGGRTVGELLAAAEVLAEARCREEERRRAEEQARLARERAAARARHLDGLAGREEELWLRAEGLIAMKRPREYDQAVELLKDLRDLADRSGASEEFDRRLGQLRERHAGKPSFMERLARAKLSVGGQVR